MVACGNKETASQSSESEKKESKVESSSTVESSEVESKPVWDEITEITMFGHHADSTDIEWFNTMLEEELGITTVFREKNAEVFTTMTASGEGADVMKVMNVSEKNTAIESGLFLDLLPYKDQLPSIFENEAFDAFVKQEIDTYGGVYSLPIQVGEMESYASAIDVRWDLYTELGAPEINNMDELLQLIKDMQELYPTTADGTKTYGFSMNTDWDGTFPAVFERLHLNLQGKLIADGVAFHNIYVNSKDGHQFTSCDIFKNEEKALLFIRNFGIEHNHSTLEWKLPENMKVVKSLIDGDEFAYENGIELPIFEHFVAVYAEKEQ